MKVFVSVFAFAFAFAFDPPFFILIPMTDRSARPSEGFELDELHLG
jgi:hypothetical protein